MFILCGKIFIFDRWWCNVNQSWNSVPFKNYQEISLWELLNMFCWKMIQFFLKEINYFLHCMSCQDTCGSKKFWFQKEKKFPKRRMTNQIKNKQPLLFYFLQDNKFISRKKSYTNNLSFRFLQDVAEGAFGFVSFDESDFDPFASLDVKHFHTIT